MSSKAAILNPTLRQKSLAQQMADAQRIRQQAQAEQAAKAEAEALAKAQQALKEAALAKEKKSTDASGRTPSGDKRNRPASFASKNRRSHHVINAEDEAFAEEHHRQRTPLAPFYFLASCLCGFNRRSTKQRHNMDLQLGAKSNPTPLKKKTTPRQLESNVSRKYYGYAIEEGNDEDKNQQMDRDSQRVNFLGGDTMASADPTSSSQHTWSSKYSSEVDRLSGHGFIHSVNLSDINQASRLLEAQRGRGADSPVIKVENMYEELRRSLPSTPTPPISPTKVDKNDMNDDSPDSLSGSDDSLATESISSKEELDTRRISVVAATSDAAEALQVPLQLEDGDVANGGVDLRGLKRSNSSNGGPAFMAEPDYLAALAAAQQTLNTTDTPSQSHSSKKSNNKKAHGQRRSRDSPSAARGIMSNSNQTMSATTASMESMPTQSVDTSRHSGSQQPTKRESKTMSRTPSGNRIIAPMDPAHFMQPRPSSPVADCGTQPPTTAKPQRVSVEYLLHVMEHI